MNPENFKGAIPDSEFIRSELPMTKEEVRTVILSKLRLFDGCSFLDIGGGSGSVSVEAARIIPESSITVIEKEQQGIETIQKNCSRFTIHNVKLVHAVAPVADINQNFDRIFIGGSGGKLDEILQWCDTITKTGSRIVMSAITLETLQESIGFFETHNFAEPDIMQLAVTRLEKRSSRYMMKAENPVFVISGEKQ